VDAVRCIVRFVKNKNILAIDKVCLYRAESYAGRMNMRQVNWIAIRMILV